MHDGLLFLMPRIEAVANVNTSQMCTEETFTCVGAGTRCR